MKSPWLKVIEQWRDEVHFGLSIPFLVGALREWPGESLGLSDSGIEQLRTLLLSIRDDTPDGEAMRLFSCGRIRNLALAPVGGTPQYCIPMPSPTRSEPALYVENGIVGEVDDLFGALVNELWHRYGENIEAGRYSVRAGVFQPFDEKDKELIQAAFERPDEDV